MLYEASIFGALLGNEDAWMYYPLSMAVIYVSSILNSPYLFWGTLFFIFPFGGFGLFFVGCRLIIQSAKQSDSLRQLSKTGDHKDPDHWLD